VLLAVACGRGDLPQDALAPQGAEARKLDHLWDIVFPIATVIFFLVQGMIVFIIWRFRARSADDAPVQVHGNAKLEIAWTIAPAAILVVVGIFTVTTLFDINRQAQGADVLQVNVTGHQWWWEYEYPDLGIVTANELHIPTGRTVQLALTSADVIHNFWPPKLSGKIYAIPGRVNHMRVEADTPGDYSGQCAEFCGLSHANMRLRVIADSPTDFEAWVANQQRDSAPPPRITTTTTTAPATPTPATPAAATGPTTSTSTTTTEKPVPTSSERVALGSELFVARGCSGCHTIKGLEGANGKVGPNLTHLQSRKRFAGAIFDLTDKNLRKWLKDPPGMKPMNPANGQGMPNLGLSDDDITSLVAYLETLK
jgi:cytochrome c oxidase subunit 2